MLWGSVFVKYDCNACSLHNLTLLVLLLSLSWAGWRNTAEPDADCKTDLLIDLFKNADLGSLLELTGADLTPDSS